MTKKITKRIFTLLLAAMLVFPLISCGGKAPEVNDPEPNTAVVSIPPETSVSVPSEIKDVIVEWELVERVQYSESLDGSDKIFNRDDGSILVFHSLEQIDAYYKHLGDNGVIYYEEGKMFYNAPGYFNKKMIILLFLDAYPCKQEGEKWGEYTITSVTEGVFESNTGYIISLDHRWSTEIPGTLVIPTSDFWESVNEQRYMNLLILRVDADTAIANDADIILDINYIEEEADKI